MYKKKKNLSQIKYDDGRIVSFLVLKLINKSWFIARRHGVMVKFEYSK